MLFVHASDSVCKRNARNQNTILGQSASEATASAVDRIKHLQNLSLNRRACRVCSIVANLHWLREAYTLQSCAAQTLSFNRSAAQVTVLAALTNIMLTYMVATDKHHLPDTKASQLTKIQTLRSWFHHEHLFADTVCLQRHASEILRCRLSLYLPPGL